MQGELGIEGDDVYDLAVKVADEVLADLYKPEDVQMELIEKLAYSPRLEAWKKLGIMPGGSKSEVFAGVVKCSTT